MAKIPDDIWEQLMAAEGRVYTNYPTDRGGETKFGISKAANPDVDVKNLTEAEARRIYEERYWGKLNEEHRDWDNFQRIVHQGPGAYAKTKDLTAEERTQKDIDKFLRIVSRDPAQRERLNGWMNRATGSDQFGARKVDLRQMEIDEIRAAVSPQPVETPEVPVEEEKDQPIFAPATNEPIPEGAPIVTERELEEVTPGSDVQKMQQAMDRLIQYPEKFPDNPEMRKKAAIEGLQEEATDERLEQMGAMSREELIAEGEQLAQTTPALLPPSDSPTPTPQAGAAENPFRKEPVANPFKSQPAKNPFSAAASAQPEPEPEQKRTPSYGAAAAYGLHLSQGATFGFGENLTGFAYAVEQALNPTNSHKSFKDAFSTGKSVAREMNREGREAQPTTAFLGDITGGIATSFALPGAGLLKGFAGTGKATKAIAGGAIEGSVAGYGYSEDGEEISGTLQGAVFGGGATAGFLGLGKAWRSVRHMDKGKNTAKTLDKMARELDGNPYLAGDETGSLAERAERKAHRGAPTDDIEFFTTAEDVDLERLLLTEHYEDFAAQINRAAPATGELPSDEVLRQGNIRDQRTQGRSWEKEWAKIQKENREVSRRVDATLDSTVSGVDPVPGTVAEVAPVQLGTPLTATQAVSMSMYRTNMIRYMQFVTSGSTRTKPINLSKVYSKPHTTTAKEIQALVQDFRKVQRAGLANDASFTVFKQQEYLLEAAADVRQQWLTVRKAELGKSGVRKNEVARVAKEEFQTALADDLGKWKRKFYETNAMFREIDRKSGLDLELLQNRAYKQNNKRTTWEASHYSRIQAFNKEWRKVSSKYSKADIYDLMARAEREGPGSIPPDALPTIQKVQEMTKGLLESSRTSGLSVADRGEFYLPRRRKNGAAFIEAMETFYEKNVQGKGREIDDLIRKVDEGAATSVDRKEMIGFIAEMRKHAKGKLTAAKIDSHFRTGVFRKRDKIKSILEADSNVLYERADTLPDFLVDKNITNSLARNVQEAGNLVFMEPVARQLDGRAQLLKSLGKPNSAEAVIAYRKDITGQFREGYLKTDSVWKERLKLKYGIERVQGIEDVVNLFANAIYPNLVGLNPASLVRNLTQPLTKTLPEMNYWNAPQVMRAYGRALKEVIFNRADLKARGIISSDTGSMIAEMGADSAVSNSLGMDFVNSFNKVAMSIFNLTDEINRAVTAELSNTLSRKIREGGPRAIQQIKHFPPALKEEALRVLRGHNVPGFEDSMRSHFAVQTQLAYGKVGNSEFVRDNGRLLSMMTKWPVAISTDVHMHLSRKEFARFGVKYLGPLLLAVTGANMVRPEEGEPGEWRQLFLGKKYGANWTPISSMSSVTATSPIISGVLSASSGGTDWVEGLLAGDRDKARKGAKAVASGIQQFVPVVGGVWKAYDLTQNAFRGEMGRSVDLLLPEEFEFDN